MRARKLILRLMLATALLLTVVAAVGTWAFRGTPEFYRRPALTSEQRADAAKRATDKLIDTKEWANQLWVSEQTSLLTASGSTRPATTRRGQSFTVSFTADELNSFLEGWSLARGWDELYAPYLRDPVLVLQDDRLILAGTPRDMSTVASVHLFPRIDGEGRFQLTIESVRAGRLPMPNMLWAGYRDRLVAAARTRLPGWQEAAEIAPNGIANEAAITADLAMLFLDVIYRRPREPVLFLPYSEKKAAVPVRLTALRVTDGAVSLTVEPMTAAERAALLERIRQPEQYGAAASVQ